MWSNIIDKIKTFFISWWMLPTFTMILQLGGFFLVYGMEMALSGFGGDNIFLICLLCFGAFCLMLGTGLGVILPIWLIVNLIVLLRNKNFNKAFGGLGISIASGIMAIFVGMGGIMILMGMVPDLFMWNVTLPKNVDFVLARNMSFPCNMEHSDEVKALREAKPDIPKSLACDIIKTGELRAPNIEKLSREAPELLHEFMLRSLYAEATNLRFNSPVLAAQSIVYPAHENDPQTHALRAYMSEYIVSISGQNYSLADAADAKWKIPLQNGWFLARQVDSCSIDGRLSRHCDYYFQVQRLDECFASLAQNPTREHLDSLLPPVPDIPFLCIWRDGGGAYDMMIVIPKDFEAGTFEVRAHEYSTEKKLFFTNYWRDEKKLGDVCRVICSDNSNMVYSGNMGEYYGSVWEIWFTPAGGGDARRVNSQLFLMEGYQH